jgi:hypothetical protein
MNNGVRVRDSGQRVGLTAREERAHDFRDRESFFDQFDEADVQPDLLSQGVGSPGYYFPMSRPSASAR